MERLKYASSYYAISSYFIGQSYITLTIIYNGSSFDASIFVDLCIFIQPCEFQLRFGLDTFASNREILNALSITRRGRQTNIAAGLRMIRDDVFVSRNGDRSGVDNVLITLTDGKANMEKEEVDRVIDSMGDCDDPSR